MTEATKTYANSSSVLFDAVYVPRVAESVAVLKELPDALRFIDDACKHGKVIAASGEGTELLKASGCVRLIAGRDAALQDILTGSPGRLAPLFPKALANHRFHNRKVDKVIT